MKFIFDYYESVEKKVIDEIMSEPDKNILTINLEEYANYLFEKYSLSEIVIDDNRETNYEKIRRYQTVPSIRGPIKKEILQIQIQFPICDNDKIDQILELSSKTFKPYSSQIKFQNGYLLAECSPEESKIQNTINEVLQRISWKNGDIKEHNEKLIKFIQRNLEKRKKQIENEDKILDEITKKVSVPLKKKNNAKMLTPPLKVKKKILPIVPPKSKLPEELYLEKEKFNAIIELIDNCCKAFENTPTTFSKMNEEELRDVILSSLNSVFEGDAVGEAFSKKGKTDIRLNIQKGGIFIAECKFWSGPKSIEKTIDQIFKYLTWRNSYGVIIGFSKRKGFTDVLENISELIPDLPNFHEGFEELEDSHFRAKFHLPEDDRKIIEIHFLVYNLYV